MLSFGENKASMIWNSRPDRSLKPKLKYHFVSHITQAGDEKEALPSWDSMDIGWFPRFEWASILERRDSRWMAHLDAFSWTWFVFDLRDGASWILDTTPAACSGWRATCVYWERVLCTCESAVQSRETCTCKVRAYVSKISTALSYCTVKTTIVTLR